MWFHNRACLDLTDYNYTAHCCTAYEYTKYVFVYSCYVFLLLLLCVATMVLLQLHSAAACRWCSSSCAGRQKLLLWPFASDISFCFLFFQTRCTFCVPLGSTVASIYLINAYHISSVITGVRDAKAGVSPPLRSPPYIYVWSMAERISLITDRQI